MMERTENVDSRPLCLPDSLLLALAAHFARLVQHLLDRTILSHIMRYCGFKTEKLYPPEKYFIVFIFLQIQSSTETEVLSLDLRKSKVTGKWGTTTTTDAKYDNARLSWKRQRSRCAEGGFKDGQPSQRMRLSEGLLTICGLLRSVHSKGSTSWVSLIVGPKRETHINR